MGLKVNAFQVITGQQRDFQLSQARLEQAMQETLQQSCVDVTLAQQIRHETLADLQFHYNLVFPAQQRFGSTVERVHADAYNMANDGASILTLFLRRRAVRRRHDEHALAEGALHAAWHRAWTSWCSAGRARRSRRRWA